MVTMDSILNADTLQRARALATQILMNPANCRLTAAIHDWMATQSVLLSIVNHASDLDEVREIVVNHMKIHRRSICKDRPPIPYNYDGPNDDTDDDEGICV